jgi:arylsulfatase
MYGGRNRKWLRRTGQGLVLVGAVGTAAVLVTDLVGVGKGRPVFVYNLLDLNRTVWSGPALDPGKHVVKFEWTPKEPGLGKGGTGVLFVDGKEVSRKTMEHSMPITWPEDETFDVGADTRTPVALLDYRYDVPFAFTGKIDKLTFDLGDEAPAAAPAT